MSRCCSWEPLIKRFQNRLSKWKAKTLSFGGRLTLIKSVLGSLGVYYFSTFKEPKKVIHKLEGIRRRFFWGGNSDVDKISWVAWDKVVSPRNKGGLGIGSLVASNNSLLTKWWWRFRNKGTSLWCNVIRSIHGPTSGVLNSNSHKKASSTWSRILNLKHELTKVGINLPTIFKKKIGDGRSTSFWHDHWLGSTTLQESFPLLYRLELNKNCLVCERTINSLLNNNVTVTSNVSRPSISWTWRRSFRSEEELNEQNDLINLLVNLHLSNGSDVWEFTYDASRRFSVNSMRKLISTMSSDNISHPTRWNKLLPSKVNILTWCVLNKRLPTRFNLDWRGIDLDTVRYPLCNNDIETEDHLFVKCPLAIDTWKFVFSWWQFTEITNSNLLDILTMVDRLPMAHKHRKFFDVVVNTTIWAIWNHRNKTVFNLKRPQKELLFNDVKQFSYNWISSRSRNITFSWIEWFCNPCNILSSIL
ncbi:RNA-directed DNA polymerase, eukaryota, reverse transcriptase zinc-binding domain protein [Tanacetum coccineum]